MASPNSPSVPHNSPKHPFKHVDVSLNRKDQHVQVPVKNNVAASAITSHIRMQSREESGKAGRPRSK